ncbi:histidinol-phosphate transaminase [Polaromonas sp.]|jgi:histidinol-phosphate aminotransferase|uniref:histidinol-phosphate transaminase n=1 Tax=Polaromonas sp. TaxID=1869339 RepID=UPI002CD52EEC|nr:histidinol-phosphate transaminase [Polaromonas sp.]HQS32654.1 histidinol-phosphate transaminase [Polaromonas sp.]HQS90903.1 histidinol-phosphate transaminase [Polaromonas sp.]
MSALDPQLKKRIRQDVQSMHAYAIQDSAGMVKLDAMENPHRLPAGLQAELGRRLGALALNRYPDGRVDDLRGALADYAQMPDGFDIMLGNGSDELISLLAMACDVPGATIVSPVPGFVMYGVSAQLQGLKFVGVPLTADFELDEAAMLAAVAAHKPAITYLAYPNNPTANLWDDAVIEKVIEAVGRQGGLVVMDEAYQPFASKSYIDRITRHGHVLLLRTLSKFGLAGVRLGYLMGPMALIAEIDKVRPPYNISVLNYECALFALEHQDVFAAQALELIAQRAMLLEALGNMAGVRAWKSDANMILIRVADAAKTFEGMKARGVLVKNVSKMHPLLLNCLRLTVGTAGENVQMLAALQESL